MQLGKMISTSKIISNLALHNYTIGAKSLLQSSHYGFLRNCAAVVLVNKSYLHSHRVSKNVEFFTAHDDLIVKTKDQYKILRPEVGERPLTLLFSWLMSRDSHIKKHINLYCDLGLDVMRVRISPLDLLRPVKGAQVAVQQVLNFLHANEQCSPLIVHGFSVGGYVCCEMAVKMAQDMDKNRHLLQRFVGQIWDSPVDVEGIPTGMPRAITRNKVMQASMEKYLRWYMKANYDSATVHYERSSAKMHECFFNAPGLFIFSKSDPISTPQMNATVYKKWEAKGIPVFVKCFDKSPHVSHFHKHRDQYETEVLAFLERVGVIDAKKKKMSAV